MTGFSSTRIQIACMDLFQSSTKFNREDATLRQKNRRQLIAWALIVPAIPSQMVVSVLITIFYKIDR